jgi:hypothetical protein
MPEQLAGVAIHYEPHRGCACSCSASLSAEERKDEELREEVLRHADA